MRVERSLSRHSVRRAARARERRDVAVPASPGCRECAESPERLLKEQQETSGTVLEISDRVTCVSRDGDRRLVAYTMDTA